MRFFLIITILCFNLFSNDASITSSSILLTNSDIAFQKIKKMEFKKLEYRIKAISKTHQILCESDNISTVNMKEYIDELCSELKHGIANKDISFNLDIDTTMPLKKAVYVGLIVNELVSNSIKYAFLNKKGIIYVSLQKNYNKYRLIVSDSGKGYKKEDIKSNSFGIKLVESLVKKQLRGKISNKIEKDIFKYEIEF